MLEPKTCPHMSFQINGRTDRVHKADQLSLPEDKRKIDAFVFEVSVYCSDCGIQFAFDWQEVADPNVIPLMGEYHAPWTDPYRSTLCAKIIPAHGLSEAVTAIHFPGTQDQKPN
jgi:hypothetical protein